LEKLSTAASLEQPRSAWHSFGVMATAAINQMENKSASTGFERLDHPNVASRTSCSKVGTWMIFVRGFTRAR
jgi:hypothetical protein